MEITRGDYKVFRFQRKNKNKEVITELPDKMYFTIKKSCCKKEALIQKTLEKGITYSEEDNFYRIEMLPEDTCDLGFGDYKYDIEIIYDQNKPKTLKVGKISIKEEVTHKENEV